MITFVRNIQFTRLLKINGRQKEFNFRKPNNREESLFTVDTAEEYGSRIIFQMQKLNGHWKIINPDLPTWIHEKEGDFHNLIEEELNSATS
ncbi:MAG: hypothetical protein ABIP80_02610 [Ferruginibacter sp.]